MRLLDLFCGAGGAATGYARAGFEVVGIDIKPQPRYPYDFRQKDALGSLEELRMGSAGWRDFDAVHASPPCQAYSGLTTDRARHPDLIAKTRELLEATGLPYVIENVRGAPLCGPVELCGSAFGLPIKRHRLFETNFPVMAPGCAHGMHDPKRYKIRQHGKERDTAFAYVFGGGQAGQTAAEWREAMGTPWMTVDEMSEAIPPAYTEHIGGYLMTHLETAVAA